MAHGHVSFLSRGGETPFVKGNKGDFLGRLSGDVRPSGGLWIGGNERHSAFTIVLRNILHSAFCIVTYQLFDHLGVLEVTLVVKAEGCGWPMWRMWLFPHT
jgi:hypothetical protein